jgi:hypothetical protein
MVENWKDGVRSERPASCVIRECFLGCFERAFSPQVVLFPGTQQLWITRRERETLHNCKKLREFFHQLVEKRRIVMK